MSEREPRNVPKEKPMDNFQDGAQELRETAVTHEEDFDSPRKVISRRNFLKVAGLGLIGAAVGSSVPALYEGAMNSFEKEKMEKEIKEIEDELSNKYGIRIRVWKAHEEDRPTGTIKESLKDKSIYRSYRSLLNLRDTLGYYPPKLINKNITGIEIVYSVKPGYEGVVAEGATPEAMTSFGGNITVRAGYQSSLSYKAVFGEVLDANVLHHEIAHTLTSDIPKEEWTALHPGVKYVDNEWIKLKKDKPKGFALPYGAKSIDEDMATVAELIFASPNEVQQLTEADDVLKNKIEYLKRWYEKKSGGEMKF